MAARRERSRPGFTLIEFGVVLAIIATLAAMVSTAYLSYLERVRVLRSVLEIKNIATALSGYLVEGESLPATLADAGLGTPVDPWGNPYQYLPLAGGGAPPSARKDRFLVPINTDFDIYSMGQDGQSVPPLTAARSRDDVVRAANGAYIGLASKF
jgi:general secretion pathway protein G